MSGMMRTNVYHAGRMGSTEYYEAQVPFVGECFMTEVNLAVQACKAALTEKRKEMVIDEVARVVTERSNPGIFYVRVAGHWLDKEHQELMKQK